MTKVGFSLGKSLDSDDQCEGLNVCGGLKVTMMLLESIVREFIQVKNIVQS